MLSFSRIDENFNVYRENKIVIFGAGIVGAAVYNDLKNICDIVCFCDNNPEKHDTELFGKKIISMEKLKEIYGKGILIQIASINYDVEIENQLVENGFSEYISYGEYGAIKEFASFCWRAKNTSESIESIHAQDIERKKIGTKERLIRYIFNVNTFNKDYYCFYCMPSKTGDYTMNNTMRKYTSDFANLWHSLNDLSEMKDTLENGKKLKFVTAVRDVVSQNISAFFEFTYCYWSIPEFWKDGGDIQFLFDLHLKKFVDNDVKVFSDIKYEDIVDKTKLAVTYLEINEMKKTHSIQYFFQEQYEKHLGINLFEYPFDKEKGYSIVKVGNIEIFIYQLERLNDIAPHLGEFLGLDEFELDNVNEGSKKWYRRSYKNALKELKISREYFENCYNSEFMRHFYSDKDIEKFKNRWKNNIYD